MDALWTEMLKGLFTLSPGFAAAALLVWWTLKTTCEREDRVREDTVQREAVLLTAAGKREEEMRTTSTKREELLQAAADRREARLSAMLDQFSQQYERVAAALTAQSVALNDGAKTLSEVVEQIAEMRMEHNQVIGKKG